MENLKLLRKNKGLTQQELANITKIPKTNISHYEANISEPNLKTLKQLADFFDCSVDYLVGHQTKQLIHTDTLTKRQQELLDASADLSDDDISKVLGYIARIKDVPVEVIYNKKVGK